MRFYAGQKFNCDKFEFLVAQGDKAPDDLKLLLRLNGYFIAVPMVLGFILTDFFFQNEERLYPRSTGKKGGDKYLGECRKAARHGWERAHSWLKHEQGELDI